MWDFEGKKLDKDPDVQRQWYENNLNRINNNYIIGSLMSTQINITHKRTTNNRVEILNRIIKSRFLKVIANNNIRKQPWSVKKCIW